jgi:hypothetical protein
MIRAGTDGTESETQLSRRSADDPLEEAVRVAYPAHKSGNHSIAGQSLAGRPRGGYWGSGPPDAPISGFDVSLQGASFKFFSSRFASSLTLGRMCTTSSQDHFPRRSQLLGGVLLSADQSGGNLAQP